jgi:hypothetical protein
LHGSGGGILNLFRDRFTVGTEMLPNFIRLVVVECTGM